MVLPIVAYGHPTLKKMSKEIEQDYPGLEKLIEDMFETMYATNGVGLAAPQINKNIRLFVLDAEPFKEDHPDAEGQKRVFINPLILEEEGEEWSYEEGCLSVPDIHEAVQRKPRIRVRYFNEKWELQDEWFDGIVARIMQHEYDHIEGKIFTEKINNMRKLIIKRKLSDITNGKIDLKYKMIFASQKKTS